VLCALGVQHWDRSEKHVVEMAAVMLVFLTCAHFSKMARLFFVLLIN